MSQPCEFTQEEMLFKFLTHINLMKKYWAKVQLEPGRDSVEQRLDGLCFSFLSMLDGSSMDIAAMEVVPAPHPSDEEYLRSEGQNWWPNQVEKLEKSGIKSINNNRAMHELWHEFCRGNITIKSLTKK